MHYFSIKKDRSAHQTCPSLISKPAFDFLTFKYTKHATATTTGTTRNPRANGAMHRQHTNDSSDVQRPMRSFHISFKQAAVVMMYTKIPSVVGTSINLSIEMFHM